MFKALLKKGLLLGAFTSIATTNIMAQDFEDMLRTLNRLKFMPKYQESRTLSSSSPILIYLYDMQEMHSIDTNLEEMFRKAPKFGYQVQKKYIGPDSNFEEIKEKLNMSQEELDLRFKHHSNFVYVEGENVYKAPVGIQTTDIDSWVSKCQQPIISITASQHFYGFCRRVISEEEDYLIVVHGLTDQEQKIAENYSRFKYKLPMLNVDKDLAEKLGVTRGVTVVKPYSKYDGDFDIESQGRLKFIHLDKEEFSFEELDSWVKKVSCLTLSYIDSFKKIYPMFSRVYNGPLKVLYVLTSQLNPYSSEYDRILKILVNVQKKYEGMLHIAILPNDDISKKLAVLRNKKLRNYRIPEVRFVDFSKLIGVEKQDGKFPIVDCQIDRAKCADLSETHYSRKNNFNKKITESDLEEFIETSLKDEYEQFYESDTTPSSIIRKLCARNFVNEVIESEEDVIVELYGKYCPGCKAFKKHYNEVAEIIKRQHNKLTIAKLCIDYNMVPEISNKIPYTPIFWFYRKGDKQNPIKFEGKLAKEELLAFINKNLTPE